MMSWLQLILGGAAAANLKRLFRWNAQSFPPCNATIVPESRGWPWNKRVVVHTTPEGDITIRTLAASEPEPRTTTPEEPPDEEPGRPIGFLR